MRLSYKGRFVFSQPLCLLVALSGFVVAAVRTAPGGVTVRLGIDTLIVNILVTVARDRDSDSERLLYFGRVIYLFFIYFFFPSTDFSTSLGRFSRNFATRRGMC